MKKLLFSMFLFLTCALTVGSKPMNNEVVNVHFYGSDLRVHFNSHKRVKVKKATPEKIAKCMNWLATATSETQKDCQRIKQDMKLCDWAYMKLVDKVSLNCLGKTNEAVVMMAKLMADEGYDVRLMAETPKKLRMLFASDAMLYHHSFFELDQKKYYVFGDSIEVKDAKVLGTQLAKEKVVSFKNLKGQQFAEHTTSRTVASKKNPNFAFTYTMNKNLIDFYGDLPTFCYDGDFMTRWTMIADLPLEEQLNKTLVSDMKRMVSGMKQQDALQQLLWWVQTGFDFAYDADVWGFDRAFYAEETLYYPSCDTEDRSILLSRLVRDVLGLKVMFVYYPGHTAIAVSITDDDVRGAYVVNKGRHYVICDPTYIGSSVGEEMPNMVGKERTVRVLK